MARKKKKTNITLMLQTSSTSHNLNWKMKSTLLKMMKVVSTRKQKRLTNNRRNKKQKNHKNNNKHKRLMNNHKKHNYQNKHTHHPSETQG